jgi:hypothetical protein
VMSRCEMFVCVCFGVLCFVKVSDEYCVFDDSEKVE